MKKIILIHWKDNLRVLIFISLVSISTVSISLITSLILDSLIKFDWGKFTNYTLLLVLTNISLLLFTYLQIKYINKTIQSMSNYLRFQTIERISDMSPVEFQKQTIGSYTSRLINDINQIEQIGFEKFYELFTNIVSLLFSLVTLFFIHWSLFLLVLIESILLIQLPKLLNKRLKDATINVTNQNDKCTSTTTHLLSGYSTFYNFKNLPYFIKKIKVDFINLSEKKNALYGIIAIVAILGGISNVTGQISAFAIAGYLALNKVIPIGILWTVSNLSSRIFNIIGSSSQNISSIQSVTPLFEKIDDFILSVKNNGEAKSPISLKNTNLILENISYSFDNTHFLFQNINYKFLSGKKYGIIGKSGSGKSTLLNILNGNILNYEGNIFLGGINLKNILNEDILDNILYIDQDPYILKGTIRENILLGDTFDDEQIVNILNNVKLSKFSENLNYKLNESGSNLSGGQKQRLALARGLIRNRKIILLDESTSNLDKKTAYEIENLVLNLENVTVIMVTHNLTSLIKDKLDGILNLSN